MTVPNVVLVLQNQYKRKTWQWFRRKNAGDKTRKNQ
ncbi:hypothetical protein NIASO_09110 [Niabella soli DSM 19437]|uniref:Uncharacterized protein n=1 Tax=Niabella soli DSM 19437 TaxID=929713 RepID=W0F393_9BACT|nr:hypothetical protein NIASO_09110 [Niabella soli DSM 19437]